MIKYNTDTLVITKYDTVTFTHLKEVEKKVIDTIYLNADSGKCIIPISEYRFKKDNEYDITARGYEVSLSNVTIFPQTEYRTVTNTVEKEVILKKPSLYLGVGFMVYNRDIIPEVGIYYSNKGKFLFGLKMGYIEGNTIWSGTIAYKITK